MRRRIGRVYRFRFPLERRLRYPNWRRRSGRYWTSEARLRFDPRSRRARGVWMRGGLVGFWLRLQRALLPRGD